MRVTMTVNGEPRQADDVWEGESLLYVLRERMGLPGSKNACEQGECGSCTVYLDGVPVCACLVAAGQAEGREVVTVEGLARRRAACTRCSRRSSRPAPSSAASARPGSSSPPTTCSAHVAGPRATPRSARRWPATCAAAPATRRSSTPCTSPPTGSARAGARAMTTATARPTTVIEGCAVVTMDADRTEHAAGHVVVDGNRITAVGAGPAPRPSRAPASSTARAAWLTPGLVNTHHHLYQWVTRGLAVDATLFEWLTTLYPVWARHRRACRATSAPAARWPGSPAPAARRAPTTTTSSPASGGDLLGAEIEAARAVGLRFHPTRGSMDLGREPGRAAARRRRRGPRRDPRRHRGRRRPLARPVARLDAAGRASRPARRSRSPASC